MCTVYRLSVTPENIVVHNKQDRGHSLYNINLCLSYFDMRYKTTAMQSYCINKELIERGNRKVFA
jgi:hypothetical protein